MIESLANAEAEAPVAALAAFARDADANGFAAGFGGNRAAVLQSEENLFEATADGVRLRSDLRRDLEALRWRADRFAEAVSVARTACGPPPVEPAGMRVGDALRGRAPEPAPEEVVWTLCVARVLFNLELFFEVHEVLEALWHRAPEPLRTFLQGLIQVAVGFHHRGSGNLRGAVSLLVEGRRKLFPFLPAAWGLELAAFAAEVDRAAETVREELAGCAGGSTETPRLRATH